MCMTNKNRDIAAELASAIDQVMSSADIKTGSWAKQTLSLEVSVIEETGRGSLRLAVPGFAEFAQEIDS